MKKECFLRVLAIMKKLRVEYARLHPLAFWNYYRDFNVRWMFRDVRRVIVMAYHACQPQAASQPQVAALASKPQAASLGCLQDEEEAEWKKRRRERRERRYWNPRCSSPECGSWESPINRPPMGQPQAAMGQPQAANGSATGGHGSATGGQWVSHTWTNLEPQVFVTQDVCNLQPQADGLLGNMYASKRFKEWVPDLADKLLTNSTTSANF